MKIGFTIIGFNQEEFIEECLKDLVPFCKDNKHLISVVSIPFVEYQDKVIEYDNTIQVLTDRLHKGDIDFLSTEPQFITEAECRNIASKPLLENDCDIIFIIDLDEMFSYENLTKIQKYIERSEFIDWFSISYKNYVGNGYLDEPFTPPRIFRVKSRNLKFSHFHFDNDVTYKDSYGLDIHFKSLSNKVIPKEYTWVTHYTWMNDEKSKNKIEFQMKHYGHCSYKWENGEIKLNDQFYIEHNQIKPKIIYDEK
jgi:hypothetical protein